MLEVHQTEGGRKQDAELVQRVDEAIVETVRVVHNVRSLETQEQQGQPARKKHGVLPLADAPVVVYDKLEDDHEPDVADDGGDEVAVTHPPAPGRAVGVPDHGDRFHGHNGDQHGHAQLDVDVHPAGHSQLLMENGRKKKSSQR